MKVIPKVGGYQVESTLATLGSVSQVNGVFSRMGLLSSSEKQPRVVAIAYNILKSVLGNLDQQFKMGFSYLVFFFFFVR